MPDPTLPATDLAPLTRNPPTINQFQGVRASHIMELPNTAWRDTLVPASFNGAQFHCEQYTVESGRRLVQHEFPKRDLPYCEDMGHRALVWEVRGYIIVFPYDLKDSELYQRDYRVGRDALIRELEKGGPFYLQVQTLPPYLVWCERYKLTESDKIGGYCTFDMSFREAGDRTMIIGLSNVRSTLYMTSRALRDQILARMNPQEAPPTGTGGGIQV